MHRKPLMIHQLPRRSVVAAVSAAEACPPPDRRVMNATYHKPLMMHGFAIIVVLDAASERALELRGFARSGR